MLDPQSIRNSERLLTNKQSSSSNFNKLLFVSYLHQSVTQDVQQPRNERKYRQAK